jgi:hypothetical protein
MLCAKLSKICPSQEAAPRRTPGYLPTFYSLREPSAAGGMQRGKSGKSVLFQDEQLTKRNHAALSAERAVSNRASCKLVAAARKWWFGAGPGRVVVTRRRWLMKA